MIGQALTSFEGTGSGMVVAFLKNTYVPNDAFNLSVDGLTMNNNQPLTDTDLLANSCPIKRHERQTKPLSILTPTAWSLDSP